MRLSLCTWPSILALFGCFGSCQPRCLDIEPTIDVGASLLQTSRKNRSQRVESSRSNGDDFKYLFILSAGGRTGSTSLLRMVNSIPGFNLAGENAGVMTTFAKMFSSIMRYSTREGEYVVSNPGIVPSWKHNPIDEQSLRKAQRDYITALIGEVNPRKIHTIGFKEVRHSSTAELDELLSVFPGARFILNTRQNITAQEFSQKRIFYGKSQSEQEIRNASLSMEQWHDNHPDISFLMRLEDFTLERFNQMLMWLGMDQCAFTRIGSDDQDSFSDVIQCDAT